MFPVNNCSPIPALMAMYENYGTLTDRDYVISVSGKQQNKTFSVVPMDKVKFRNEKAKPFAEKAILKMLDKAFPCEDAEDDDDDDYEEKPKKRPAKSSSKPKKREEPEDEEDWDEDGNDYDSMTPQELFKECKKRKIEVVPKKPKKYYINLLEEYDKAQEDWDEDDEYDDEEDWEEDDE